MMISDQKCVIALIACNAFPLLVDYVFSGMDFESFCMETAIKAIICFFVFIMIKPWDNETKAAPTPENVPYFD